MGASRRLLLATLILSWLGPVASVQQSSAQNQPPLTLEVIDGFEARLVVDDDLAHDIHSMTLDPDGQLVVGGPGYIRRMFDDDGDGVFDRAQEIVKLNTPAVMGLCFDGTDLYCSTGSGVFVFSDADSDGVADGPGKRVFELPATGEHHLHAIRKGEDGWWYLLAGNQTDFENRIELSDKSPIRSTRAGVLFRARADFSDVEVLTHGFRNAYDFDFTLSGGFVTYDSDGERDVSLPWYRPTRVFRCDIGSDAGWVSRSWKRPNYDFEMPTVMAELGRGSPTGVAICPANLPGFDFYAGNAFVLDWTLGRLVAVPMEQGGAPPELFAQATGTGGFAPTDLVFSDAGELYVSVGGRGTRGGVYRINAASESASLNEAETTERIGRQRTPQERAAIARSNETLRHWSWRCRGAEFPTPMELLQTLSSLEPIYWDQGIGNAWPAFVRWSPDDQQLWISKWSELLEDESLKDTREADIALSRQWLRHSETNRLRYSRAPEGLRFYAIGHGARFFEQPRVDFALSIVADKQAASHWSWASDLQIERNRLVDRVIAAQRCLLAERGPTTAPVFDGYQANVPESATRDKLAEWFCATFPTGDRTLNHELCRLGGMLADDESVREELIAFAENQKRPLERIHALCSLGATNRGLSAEQATQLAEGWLALGRDFDSGSLPRDRNWQPRLRELFSALDAGEFSLARRIVESDSFGSSTDLWLYDILPDPWQRQAASRFAENTPESAADADLAWVRILTSTRRPQDLAKLREWFDDGWHRAAIVQTLAKHPQEDDGPRFVWALQQSSVRTQKAGLDGLKKLPATIDTAATLLTAMLRLGDDKGSKQLAADLADYLVSRLAAPSPSAESAASKREHWLAWAASADISLDLDQSSEDWETWRSRLSKIQQLEGDAANGEPLFVRLQCASCHQSQRALGPDLKGVAKRFGSGDLLRAIVAPSETIPDRYRGIQIETDSGEIIAGYVVYESVDGLLLRTADQNTKRIEAGEIIDRAAPERSLMPAGLLDDITNQQVADLLAYLNELR